MGALKFIVWTACAVGLGIFLATGEVDGRTPLEHMQRAWKRSVKPNAVDRMKDGLEDAYEDAKGAVSRTTDSAPRERISAEDRAAVNRIIAQKK
ncbi:hypothetical protein JY651_28140 [Pyxidicoccus parkwayensis]|jgi:hypothetical protein|uniref:Uncharacterized protein n=1 Tax=Pyxidicoccus parkwayensis TaxID=2813578 RepID=A0ABX7NK51_9BACT|nr:hypothetical protein [Pyxidicoccus parkwaysis]QSQ19211.1 hypothetical protein JY651_28140 [Pyxidicoccus parkwaysis]